MRTTIEALGIAAAVWAPAVVDDRATVADRVLHPGGMDYDGTYIWVPLSEYRPDSHAIVYKVDPETMRATDCKWAGPFARAHSRGLVRHSRLDVNTHPELGG